MISELFVMLCNGTEEEQRKARERRDKQKRERKERRRERREQESIQTYNQRRKERYKLVTIEGEEQGANILTSPFIKKYQREKLEQEQKDLFLFVDLINSKKQGK